jgi:hypothetical protein
MDEIEMERSAELKELYDAERYETFRLTLQEESCRQGKHEPERIEVLSQVDVPQIHVYAWHCAFCMKPLYEAPA